MTKMTPIKDALRLTDPTAILQEIKARQKMRGQLVGTLYPSILVGEEDKLQGLYAEIMAQQLQEPRG